MAWYLIGTILIVGLWGVMAKPNIVKKVMALSIANSAIILLFIYHASLSGQTAPIVEEGVGSMADPIPQALMLTAIVVGICILALALALAYQIYNRFGTLDIREVERNAWNVHD